jgi:glycosyltransferase involved in cell wall biosynthesis
MLSLCIPTFNRCNKLSEFLLSLDKINKENANKIEICISNNASTDNTNEVLNAWKSKNLNRYIKININQNLENLGATQNIIKLLNFTTQKYVLFSGDDDIVNSTEIEILLNLLSNEHSERHIILNSNFSNGIFNAFKSFIFILIKGVSSFGFIGKHVFLKSNIPSKLNKEDLLSWPHLYFFFNILLSKGMRILSIDVIKNNRDDNTFHNSEIWVKLILLRIKIINTTIKPLFLKILLFARELICKQLQAGLILSSIRFRINNKKKFILPRVNDKKYYL